MFNAIYHCAILAIAIAYALLMKHSELRTVATRIRPFAIHTALLWPSKKFLLVMIMHG